MEGNWRTGRRVKLKGMEMRKESEMESKDREVNKEERQRNTRR